MRRPDAGQTHAPGVVLHRRAGLDAEVAQVPRRKRPAGDIPLELIAYVTEASLYLQRSGR